ncbi:Molybdenum cofactor biosynthesis protein A (moaA) [Plesiocystis pacifica SIR-1]|uniref:Molybdenum cofactor biosynthesis protein A (MoaA) n=1 Tax=Plesiocystis pacifica SIR-1 TaxID=391625 RepID=A6FZF6_9BACT|nr:radical SAM protein [Plesiocystis pacifica]EDM81040.1 Molybdenum cofactor biosynthesis protein A (moaA) [Plesiocystis pacifica SIR-1]
MDGGTATSQAQKNVTKEDAAHQKRNWVRLTFDCNDNCIFCLDSHTHNGTYRSREEVKAQILDGRRKGAERLILSGGEPTIHPDYAQFVRLGRLAGYKRIQTVTNGRLFAYKDFLTRCIDEGLGEITFSIHGVNARIHDALVGTKGAFEQEIKGLQNALDDGRVIINIDVCVNRGNVKTLPDLIEKFTNMGVREYDLLHVIPFGRAYTEGKETLFYDLEEMRPYLLKAFEYSKRPDMHIWLNRFPVPHLEGFENLIQDPYKLNDEVRGRKEEYELLLDEGVPLDCRAPHRCSHCYMEPICDELDEVRALVKESAFEVIRYDTEWEAKQGPVFGGDPASAERSKMRRQMVEMLQAAEATGSQVTAEAAAFALTEKMQAANAGALAQMDPNLDKVEHKKLRLPVLQTLGMNASGGMIYDKPEYPALDEQITRALKQAGVGAMPLWLVAPNLDKARAGRFELFGQATELELELEDYAGLADALTLADGKATLFDRELTRVVVRTAEDAQAMLALEADFEVCVMLSKAVEPWLLELAERESVSPRLALRQPTHERLTESAEQDLDLPAFFSRFGHAVPVDDVPSCVLGRPARARRGILDTSMMTLSAAGQEGKLEIFRYIKRYILDRYWRKSLRCKTCVYTESCRGMHISYIRAHGFALMDPVEAAAAQ